MLGGLFGVGGRVGAGLLGGLVVGGGRVGAGVGAEVGITGVGAVVGTGVVAVTRRRRFVNPFPVTCTQAVRNSVSQAVSSLPNCLISFAAGPVGLFLLPQSSLGRLFRGPQHCPLLPHSMPPVGKV